MFYKIKGGNDIPEEITFGLDDIASHIGISNTRSFHIGVNELKNHPVTVSNVHNSSHLEYQNAASMGKTRAKQFDYGSKRAVLNIQGHGDSAFIGQGSAYEALGLCNLPNYSVGGTIHFITNN